MRQVRQIHQFKILQISNGDWWAFRIFKTNIQWLLVLTWKIWMASCSAKRRKFLILFFIQAQLLSSWISQSSAIFLLPSGRSEISLQNLLFQQIMAGAFLLVKADKKWHSSCKTFSLLWGLLYSVWMGFSFSFFHKYMLILHPIIEFLGTLILYFSYFIPVFFPLCSVSLQTIMH